jgi:hypothetical protein
MVPVVMLGEEPVGIGFMGRQHAWDEARAKVGPAALAQAREIQVPMSVFVRNMRRQYPELARKLDGGGHVTVDDLVREIGGTSVDLDQCTADMQANIGRYSLEIENVDGEDTIKVAHLSRWLVEMDLDDIEDPKVRALLAEYQREAPRLDPAVRQRRAIELLESLGQEFPDWVKRPNLKVTE